jgi:CRP/FNR family transcriptional regulator, cyclic AMP receptor protein
MPRQATIASAASAIGENSFYGMLTEADRAQLLKRGATQLCARKSVLMREDDRATNVTILLRGWVRSAFTAATGANVAQRIYGPGELFGSEAIFSDQNCTETVTALAPCLTLGLSGGLFNELILKNSNIADKFHHVMGQRAQAAEDQAKLRFCPPSERLARILLDLADRHGVQAPDGITIPIEVPQEDLAGIIGVSRSTAARVLRCLRDRQVVNTGYRRTTIISLAELKKIAGAPAHESRVGSLRVVTNPAVGHRALANQLLDCHDIAGQQAPGMGSRAAFGGFAVR